MKNKTIVVAGGAGFIGYNLVTALQRLKDDPVTGEKCSWSIFVWDNQSSGPNWNRLLKTGKFVEGVNLIDLDITLENEVIEATKKMSSLDYLINLACPASPKYHTAEHSEEIMDACTVGVRNLMKVASVFGSTVIHASSSEIYGDCTDPVQEGYTKNNVWTLGPRSCYKEGKRMSETICMNLSAKYHVRTFIFRIFNTYGKYMDLDDGRVITSFLKSFRDGTVPVVHPGSRNYLWVDSLVEAFLNIIMDKIAVGLDEGCHVFNLGQMNAHYDTYTLLKKAACIWYGTSIAEVTHIAGSGRPGDVRDRNVDTKRAQELLKWFPPTVPLGEGLQRMVNWVKDECK